MRATSHARVGGRAEVEEDVLYRNVGVGVYVCNRAPTAMPLYILYRYIGVGVYVCNRAPTARPLDILYRYIAVGVYV